MSASILKSHRSLAVATLASVAALAATTQAVAAGPVKLVLASHIGWEVDKGSKGKVCDVPPEEGCQPGIPNSQPGGFKFPEGVAGAVGEGVYVDDRDNNRVQELTSSGAFVLMFGREVNQTEDATPGATEVEKDACTVASGDTCKAGVAGSVAGALDGPASITVDPGSEAIYVEDLGNQRIDKYTASGQFLWMAGKEVNQTKDEAPSASEAEKNICTATSKDVCKAGVRSSPESGEACAFDLEAGPGDLLAVGGASGHAVYVGDTHRVQELGAEGECTGEIKFPAIVASNPSTQVTAIAVNTETLYLVYGFQGVIHELDATTGNELTSLEVEANEPGGTVAIRAIALDASGHLAVSANEGTGQFGTLYQASDGALLTTFIVPHAISNRGVRGIGFDTSGNLYADVRDAHEIMRYTHESVAELITLGGTTCKAGAELETSATFACIVNGDVNPYSVTKTEVWFEWERRPGEKCGLASATPHQPVETVEALLPASATVEGLRPNEGYCYRLAGNDQNVQSPEGLSGRVLLFDTAAVPPKIAGEPTATFVTSVSAVLFGELNPENATTEYFFEYGSPQALEECPEGVRKSVCPSVAVTGTLESKLYGRMGATLEARDLEPDTVYSYRLAASNGAGDIVGPQNTFTTAPAPAVRAQTGVASGVGTTTAVISGVVEPDGQSATYTFELGVNQGAGTQYGIVFSGPVGASTTPVEESLQLTGLQPGTEYAYRIAVHFGTGSTNGSSATGAAMTFVTEGLPSVLMSPAPLPLLETPPIRFPKPECKRDKKGRCIGPKKGKPKRTNSKRRRAAHKSRKGLRRRA